MERDGMTLMAKKPEKLKRGRPKSPLTLVVEKAYNDYEGKDAAFDIPRIVHQEHPSVSINEARKVYWKIYRQPKLKLLWGKKK